MMKVKYWVLMVGCMFKQMVGIPNSKKYEMYLKVKRFGGKNLEFGKVEEQYALIGSQSILNG